MQSFDASTLAGLRMECDCGRTHEVPIRMILTGSGALGRLEEALEEFRGRHVFLAGDNNTMPLAEAKVREALDSAGCETVSHTFSAQGHLILNEALIGAMLIRMPSETELIVVIGSGSLNDLCRVIAARCRLPYIIIATAPSMDGYASAVSPIVLAHGKQSMRFCVPNTIITDPALMRTAPDVMLSAGVGDILGKYVALRDWRLAVRETGEYVCEHIISMVGQAVDRCVSNIDGIRRRDNGAIGDMADALIMSGAAIAMHGTLSRPASGCEHQLAHYWEVALLKGSAEPPLHGNLVGFGTQVACRLYELAGEELDLDLPGKLPTAGEIAGWMSQLGKHSTKEALGVTRELFYESFFHATRANGRYTLISYLTEQNRIEHYAKQLTDEFFA